MAYAEEAHYGHEMLVEAMDSPNERERHILTDRRLVNEPKALEGLN